jgi:spore coat polysaccharide biosynthesis protein SpsF
MSNFLIRTLGDRTHGMGHVVRCLTLADELSKRGHGIMFATENETPAYTRILNSSNHHPVIGYDSIDMSWARRHDRHDAIIIDLEGGPTEWMLHVVRSFRKVIVIGGSGYVVQDRQAIRDLADLFICQTILETDGDVTGVEHIIIRPEYAECVPDFNGHILLCMGGADIHDMTPTVLEALYGVDRAIVIVNGPASTLPETDTVRVIHAPDSLAPYLNGASLFVGALGMSAFEAAAAGVPSLLIAWTEDHEKTSKALAAGDVAVSLGMWDRFDGEYMAGSAEAILTLETRWLDMSKSGKGMVDGKGAARVSDRIEALLSGVEPEPKSGRVVHGEATVKPRKMGGKRERKPKSDA